MTETVQSVWLEGDMAVVLSELENRVLPSAAVDPSARPVSNTKQVLRFVAPPVIAASREDVARFPTEVPKSCQSGIPREDGTVAIEPFLNLLPVEGDMHCAGVREGRHTVVTPAGTFKDCLAIEVLGGASHGATRWFCSGVGLVGFGFGDCAMYHCSGTTAQLVRWQLGALP